MFDKYRKPLVLLIVALSLALLVACAWPLGQLALGEVPSMVPTPTPQPAPALPVATQGQVPLPNVSISAVVQQVRPAVVQIINKQVLDYGYYEPVEQQAGIGWASSMTARATS